MLGTIWRRALRSGVMRDADRLMTANEYRAYAAALAGARGNGEHSGKGHWSLVADEIRRRRRRLPPMWSRCM